MEYSKNNPGGLTENQLRSYRALLRLHEANASEVAEKASMKRSTTHDNLNTLAKIGLISKIKKDKKITFRSEDPECLKKIPYEKAKQETKNLEKVIPSFKSEYNEGKKIRKIEDVEMELNKQDIKGILQRFLQGKLKLNSYHGKKTKEIFHISLLLEK